MRMRAVSDAAEGSGSSEILILAMARKPSRRRTDEHAAEDVDIVHKTKSRRPVASRRVGSDSQTEVGRQSHARFRRYYDARE